MILPKKPEEFDALFGFYFQNLEVSDAFIEKSYLEFTSSVILVSINPSRYEETFKKPLKQIKDDIEVTEHSALDVERAFPFCHNNLLKLQQKKSNHQSSYAILMF
jgi:hypothetical protein